MDRDWAMNIAHKTAKRRIGTLFVEAIKCEFICSNPLFEFTIQQE